MVCFLFCFYHFFFSIFLIIIDLHFSKSISVDLSTSINVEVLRPLLTNEDFMKRIGDMLPQSTASSDSSVTKTTTVKPLSEQFLSTVQSPQFQQALNSFSHALQSGQLGPLIQQFGLPESCVTAANKGSMLFSFFLD